MLVQSTNNLTLSIKTPSQEGVFGSKDKMMNLPSIKGIINNMSRHLKSFLVVLTIMVVGVFALAQPAFAQTDEWTGVCTDTQDATGVATIQGIQCLVGNILQIAVSGIGLAGFVMLIIGSFKYLASGGNPKTVDDSRKTITFAIGGLLLAVSAYFILNIVADFTGVRSILNFTIPRTTSTPDSP
jgi:hypothetical protein